MASIPDRGEELKARLLAAFCPVLWFDASEKHFPVSVETFISSALLLRKERSPGELRQQQQEQQQQQQQHQEDKTLHDRGSLRQAFAVSSRDILSSNGSSFCSQTDGDDGCNGDATDPLTASSDIADPLERREHAPGQRCGECGKGKGWRVPLKKGWSVVPLPVGSKNWSTETLLEQQRVSGVRCVFRLEPHSCIWKGQAGELSAVPCYAFADLLNVSMVAPFLRRGGLEEVYELKYAFLYGYNGTTFALPCTSVGVHTGDLEHVTIRVDARKMIVLEAFFAAHSTGEGKWIPSRAFHEQVKSLEARAHPGIAFKVADSKREFLETERATTFTGDSAATVGERLVIYPARDGHASYHMPKRWRRFVGLGDDMCGGDGKVWRPSPVMLDHPDGKKPPWLQFRSRYGAPGCIPSEGFWKSQGEPLRRCSAEDMYRSLVEEGLVPDRGVRLGRGRRMLHGNGERGIWLVRHRQTEKRLPILDTWTGASGLGSGRPRNNDPPRIAGRVWLHDWDFIRDWEGRSTDAEGWLYCDPVGDGHAADTGKVGKARDRGLLINRSRGRVWFRVAGTPDVQREIEEAYRQDDGRYPRPVLAFAALDVAGRGDRVTSSSILRTVQEPCDCVAYGRIVGEACAASAEDPRRSRGGFTSNVANSSHGGGSCLNDDTSGPRSGDDGDTHYSEVKVSRMSISSFGYIANRSLGSC